MSETLLATVLYGLECSHCGHFVSAAAATGTPSPDRLSDPFEATCPCCGGEASYAKSSIEAIEAE